MSHFVTALSKSTRLNPLMTTEIEIIEKLAKLGNADAQFNLGVMYQEGQGVVQDYIEAAKWYRNMGCRPLETFELGKKYVNKEKSKAA